MTQSLPVRITVLLPTSDYRAYVRAAQLLARVMRAKAPAAAALIQAQLVRRDATGVADHYLDSIEWPLQKGRVVTLRRFRRKTQRARKSQVTPRRPRDSHLVPPHDPTRN